MKPMLRHLLWVTLIFTAWEGLGGAVMGQAASPAIPAAASPAGLPPLPVSPTERFRVLLKMTEPERTKVLTNQPAEIRRRLVAKIAEYEALTPDAREARLHATELHEYLQLLVLSPATNRAAQVAAVPAGYQREVANRLMQFDLLPPGLREEALGQEATAGYFIGPSATRPKPMPPVPAPPVPPDPTKALRSLPPAERAEVFASFEQFFDMDKVDQDRIIAAVPAQERARVLKTIRQIGQLPKAERRRSLEVMSTLVEMDDQQRQLFFNSAERWNAMSPAEQETWLKVVKHLPPQPPLPPPPPLTPPAPGNRGALSAITNPGK